MAAADAHAAAVRMSTALQKWRQGADACVRTRRGLRELDACARADRGVRALRAWRRACAVGDAGRRAGCLVLAALSERMAHETAARAVRAWRAAAAARAARRAVACAAAHHMQRRRAAAVLATWRWYAARRTYLRHCGEAMARAGRRCALRGVFSAWEDCARACVAERSVCARGTVQARAVLRVLAAYVRHRHAKRGMDVAAAAACVHARQASVLRALASHRARRHAKVRPRSPCMQIKTISS